MPRVSLLAIGTELTTGSIINSNSSHLAALLTKEGFSVDRISSVADEREAILDELRLLSTGSELVIVTGGLGPTSDDITRDCVAEFLGQPLELNAESMRRLEARFEKRGRPMRENNRRQSWFPRSATVLENPIGTADGFMITHSGSVIVCLPGVPREMELLFSKLSTWLEERFPGRRVRAEALLRCFGLSESYIASLVDQLHLPYGVALGYRPRFPEVWLTFSSRTDSALEDVQRAAGLARQALGDAFVFSDTPEQDMNLVVLDLLRQRNVSIGFAESCSGGLLADRMVQLSGASANFRGSVVCYSNAAKRTMLEVSEASLSAHGAVSEQVAREMARGARKAFGADLCVSVTGIAGPDGGTPEKPVGTVWFALADERGVEAVPWFLPVERNMFRDFCATFGLDLVRRRLLGYDLHWKRQ